MTNSDMDTQVLLKKVAEHLTGMKCTIRWQNPVTSNAIAQVYQTEGGTAVIDISDAPCLETKWDLLLHELAHIKLGHHKLTRPGSHRKPSRSETQVQTERDQWRRSSPEAEANKLAEIWKAYAENNAYKYFLPSITSVVEAHLKALLDY